MFLLLNSVIEQGPGFDPARDSELLKLAYVTISKDSVDAVLNGIKAGIMLLYLSDLLMMCLHFQTHSRRNTDPDPQC